MCYDCYPKLAKEVGGWQMKTKAMVAITLLGPVELGATVPFPRKGFRLYVPCTVAYDSILMPEWMKRMDVSPPVCRLADGPAERLNKLRVKLGTRTPPELLKGLFLSHDIPVSTLRGHGVIGISYAYDPGANGYFFTL